MSDRVSAARSRIDSVDFWRGYLLCTIFVNHIPGNAFEPLTQKNFGFSDSAEGFVFISGLAIALAYGRRFAAGERAGVTRSLFRRALQLYGLHVFLSLAGLAIFIVGAAFEQSDSLLSIHGRELAVSSPGHMIVGVLSLGHQFGYFNILPMYVLMLAIAPLLLLLAQAGRWLMLAASFTLYALATCGCNLPNWPETGSWFFDPFAWQFMVAIGIAVGLESRLAPIPRTAPLILTAAAIVAASAFCVSDGLTFWPGLDDQVHAWAYLDKTTMGLGRLIHFSAVAYLIYASRLTEWIRGAPAFAPLCAIGRQGLWMFCALSLMAAGGQVIVQYAGHTVGTDVVMVGGGLLLLAALARFLEQRTSGRSRRRKTDQPPACQERPVSIRPAAMAWGDRYVTGETASPAYAPR